MPKYTVRVTTVEVFLVEAENEEAAEHKWQDGQGSWSETTDVSAEKGWVSE